MYLNFNLVSYFVCFFDFFILEDPRFSSVHQAQIKSRSTHVLIMRECVCVCVCARVCESSGIISLSKEDQEISAVELWGGCDQFSGDRTLLLVSEHRIGSTRCEGKYEAKLDQIS